MPHLPSRRPRRIMTRTLAFGVGALAAAGLITWTPAVASGWNQGSAEATLWQLLNGARVNNGRAPLQQHGTLISLARWRSADMLAKDYFSHTIAGCGCLVYAYYDSNGLSYDWAGENIGWNSGLEDSYSPVRVHEKFMASPGHRANVLDPSFTHGGVGAAAADNQMYQGYVQNTRMYTELFMEARGAAPAPPPSGGGGGGGSGGSGGGGSTAPAQPAAQAPAATPAPEPSLVSVDRPQRPESSAGLDGVAELVTEPSRSVVAGRTSVDDVATARAATAPAAAKTASNAVARGELQVTAASAGEPGLLEGLLAAVAGFLFG